MTGAIVLLLASALGGLPPLPARGLAHETKAGVQLQMLTGRSLATLPGLDLAPDKRIGGYLIMRDRRGRLFTLDPTKRRVVECHEALARMTQLHD